MAIAEFPTSPKASRAASAAGSKSANPATRVQVVDNADALKEHREEWQNLADQSLEPNVFYEPWLVQPAFETLRNNEAIRFVFIYNRGRLDGFFPVQELRRYRHFPVRVLTMWKHLHCFLCTPLIRPEGAEECLASFLEWARQAGAAAVEFNTVRGDGRFQQLLVEHVFQTGRLTFEDEKFTRAILERAGDGESYVQATLSAGNRRKISRDRKKLGKLGKLEVRALERSCELNHWLEQFLALEASGWKQQTALRADAAQAAFFLETARAAFDRNRLMMLALTLDGRFIAMKCNFLSAGGAFAYKVAFDENYRQFYPGVQLEVDNILAVHDRSDIPWLDSCAAPDHMINRLWKERRTIQSLLVSTGNWRGDLLVSALPMLRWLGRLRPRKGEDRCFN